MKITNLQLISDSYESSVFMIGSFTFRPWKEAGICIWPDTHILLPPLSEHQQKDQHMIGTKEGTQ